MSQPSYQKVVVLTGAGISAESGLGTFRDQDGIWTKYDLEEVATPQGFRRNPDFVHGFHNELRVNLDTYQPNPAHHALARLEAEHPGEVLVVTQNVDDLHERAGSRNLIHMHGELYKVRCAHCAEVARWERPLWQATACPACAETEGMRPHVVWFGEMPFEMGRIQDALDACDLFISIGTSGHVYPAAGFVEEVRRAGRAHTVELNLEPSEGISLFAEAVHGLASEVVPAYVERLLG